MIVSHSFLLRQKKCFRTNVIEKIKIHIFYVQYPPPPENRAACEIMRKNTVEPCRPQITIWLMRIACWITESENTDSYHVTLIAFPQRQWLHERASMLRCTYIVCLLLVKADIIVRSEVELQCNDQCLSPLEC